MLCSECYSLFVQTAVDKTLLSLVTYIETNKTCNLCCVFVHQFIIHQYLTTFTLVNHSYGVSLYCDSHCVYYKLKYCNSLWYFRKCQIDPLQQTQNCNYAMIIQYSTVASVQEPPPCPQTFASGLIIIHYKKLRCCRDSTARRSFKVTDRRTDTTAVSNIADCGIICSASLPIFVK